MAALFGVCIIAAIILATQRGFFEKFVTETYSQLPQPLEGMAQSAAEGNIDSEEFEALAAGQRMALYDDWMLSDDPPEVTPGALVAADKNLYFSRARRTIACGNSEQRLRAVMFLKLSRSGDAIPILRKAHGWALKRRVDKLVYEIEEAIYQLREVAEE